MNIDVDDIMLFTSQSVSRLICEYAKQRHVKSLEENAKFLVEQITSYLSEDGAPLAVKKASVEFQVGVMVGVLYKITPIQNEQEYRAAFQSINQLHQNFVAYCKQNENLFVGAYTAMLNPSPPKNKI